MMRVLAGDTEDIKSSREGSGGLGTDMLELDERSVSCRHQSCHPTKAAFGPTRVCIHAYTH